MPRLAAVRNALAATTAASVLALVTGCAVNPMGGNDPTFSATLSGAAEVPPVQTAGTGTLEARFDKETQLLRWKLTYSGLSGPITAAHFHGPATAGINAGVALPLKPPITGSVQGEATLTPVQTADLMAGKWYINLHTAAHPSGEIRGQVNPTR